MDSDRWARQSELATVCRMWRRASKPVGRSEAPLERFSSHPANSSHLRCQSASPYILTSREMHFLVDSGATSILNLKSFTGTADGHMKINCSDG